MVNDEAQRLLGGTAGGLSAAQERIESLDGPAEQADVDELFGLPRSPDIVAGRPLKGHSASTLKLEHHYR